MLQGRTSKAHPSVFLFRPLLSPPQLEQVAAGHETTGGGDVLKWLSLASAVAMLLVCGMVYLLGLWWRREVSQALDRQRGVALAEASNLGFCVGPHIGVFVDRFGPRTGALVAAILTAKSLESPAWSFEATAAMFVLVGQSSSLAYKGFLPANRGKVIGVLDGAFGLSPALFSAIYTLHFSPRVGSFFLLVAGCLFGVSLLGHQPYTHLQPATPVHVTAVHWMDAAVDWREALARAKWRLRAFATPCVAPPFGAS